MYCTADKALAERQFLFRRGQTNSRVRTQEKK